MHKLFKGHPALIAGFAPMLPTDMRAIFLASFDSIPAPVAQPSAQAEKEAKIKEIGLSALDAPLLPTSLASQSTSSTLDSESGNDSESSSETGSESDEKEDEVISAPLDAAATSAPTSSATPSVKTTGSARKGRPKQAAKQQENDLLLAVYDALAAYRRPSKLPSQARKLASINATFEALEKLKQLVLQEQESTPIKMATPSKPSFSSTPPFISKSASATTKATTSAEQKDVQQAKQDDGAPKTVYDYFCKVRIAQIRAITPKKSIASIKPTLRDEWNGLCDANKEVWLSRFSQLPSPQALSSDINYTASTSQQDRQIQSSSYLVEEWKQEERPVEMIRVHASSSAAQSPPAGVFVWKLSVNPTPPSPMHAAKLPLLNSVKIVSALKLPTSLFAVSLSRDGRVLAASTNQTVFLFDVESSSEGQLSLKAVGKLKVDFGTYLSHAMRLSADGSKLYTCEVDRQLHIWDLKTRTKQVTPSGHADVVSCLTLSPAGTLLATGSGDCQVIITDTTSLKIVSILGSHQNKRLGPFESVSCLAFSPNGKYLACGSLDKSLRVWNVANSSLEARFDGHTAAIMSIAWQTDDSVVSTCLDGYTRSWSLSTPDRTSPAFSKTVSPIFASGFVDIDRDILMTAAESRLTFSLLPTASNAQTTDSSTNSAPPTLAILLGHTSPVLDASFVCSADVDDVKKLGLFATASSDGTCVLWQLGHS